MHTILLIDDDPRFLKGFAQTFGTLSRRSARTPGSLQLLIAQGGARGREVLNGAPVELVLVNIEAMGPEPTGYIAEIHAVRPGVPIFILSINGNDPRFDACMEAGASRVFNLPITRSEILPIFGAVITKLEEAARVASVGDRIISPLRDALHLRGMRAESVILVVQSLDISGRVFLKKGQIIHADAGTLWGVAALRRLLGESDVVVSSAPFDEPLEASMSPGLWEYLHAVPVDTEGPEDGPSPDPNAVSAGRFSFSQMQRSPTGPVQRIDAGASSEPDSQISAFLEKIVMASASNMVLDTVGGTDSVLIMDLMSYIERRSRIVGEKLGLPNTGSFEFVGSQTLAVVTFGERTQGFAVTRDPARSGSEVATVLQAMAQGRKEAIHE
jgi:DNA-binding NarL/FixJ family response regulator